MVASHKSMQWKLKDLLPALAVLLIGLFALAYAMLLPQGDTGQFAVLSNPWSGASQAIELVNRADAQIISFNERTNVIIVYSERPDAVQALYDAGAWLVFEPNQLSTCFDLNSPKA